METRIINGRKYFMENPHEDKREPQHKTPEQLREELDNWEDQQIMDCKKRQQGFTIERQLLPETDYKLEAMRIAATLKNNNLDELLGRYEEIYKILTEKPVKKTWVQQQDAIANKKWEEQQQKVLDRCLLYGGEHLTK